MSETILKGRRFMTTAESAQAEHSAFPEPRSTDELTSQDLDDLTPVAQHPALERFFRQHDDGERLLVIRAPQGTGRHWFAAGWQRGPNRSILEWAPETETSESVIQRLRELQADDPTGRTVLLTELAAPIQVVATAFPLLTAGPADLLLTEEEIDGLRRGRLGDFAETGGLPTARVIYGFTGGWLRGVEDLLDRPTSITTDHQLLAAPMVRWLRDADRSGAIAEVAYLPVVSPETLRMFHGEGGHAAPTVDGLATLGLLRKDHAGGWFMPDLVRSALKTMVLTTQPDRVELVIGAATHAMSDAGHLQHAVTVAPSGRTWASMRDLLVSRAPDLFVSDTRGLMKILNLIPRKVRTQYPDLNLFIRMLSPMGRNQLVTPTLSVQPDLDRDRTAHRLIQRAELLYRSPNSLAVSYGMMQCVYLRHAGHYEAAADAAIHLLRALDEASGTEPINPTLAGFARLHAGIGLHLADRLPEARLAYLAALEGIPEGQHHFVKADILSKLALLLVEQGETHQARRVLEASDEPLSRVRWGRSMVGRCGQLARIWLAVQDLDLATAEQILSELPEQPDADEFWAVHAHLLAQVHALQGGGTRSSRHVSAWRRDRPYAAAAPHSDRMLTEALHRSQLLAGSTTEILHWDSSQVLANLEALRQLLVGDPDGALRALRIPVRTGQRQQQVADLLRVYAERWPLEDPDKETLRLIAEIHSLDGETADLVPLCRLGMLPWLQMAGVVDKVQARRLSAVTGWATLPAPQPKLTPREREVLDFLRQRLTRRQIARATVRSENTVKAQLRSLYAKLDATSVEEALERARSFGL